MGFGKWFAGFLGTGASARDAQDKRDEHDRLIREGHAFHASGAYDKARQCYRRILALQPEHAEAHYLLGVASEAMGDLAEAERSYARAIELEPGHAQAHNNLGCLLQAQGNIERAEEAFRGALSGDPALAQAHYNLGAILSSRGDHDEAIECYRRALALEPGRAQVRLGLGLALQRKGDAEGAIENFQEALALDPETLEAARQLGIVWFERGDAVQAEIFTSRALQLDPSALDMHIHLGNIHRHCARLDEALASFRKAVGLDPASAQAHNNLGSGYLDLGRVAEAVAEFREAVALDRGLAEAHLNLGIALQRSGADAEAIRHYRTALEVKPDFAEACVNLGGLLEHEGDPQGALESYARAVAIKPDYAQARFNLSLQHLLQGRFAQGWEEYEWRWRLPDMGLGGARAYPDRRHWEGEPLEGRTILLFAEQGFGDAIQFVRYASMVAERGGRVIVSCHPKLKALLATVAGVHAVSALGEPQPDFDLCCSLLSLPGIFRSTLETLPARVPYLQADPERARYWRTRLAADRARLKVGLFWATDVPNTLSIAKSLSFDMLAPLSRVQGISFYSLQRGSAAAQVAGAPEGMALTDLSGELADFSDDAALIENLDLVLSIDTATAHLAGALGRPVWILTHFPTEWRWLLDREDSPWYPTMRLFRQGRDKRWEAVVARIAVALEGHAAAAGFRHGG